MAERRRFRSRVLEPHRLGRRAGGLTPSLPRAPLPAALAFRLPHPTASATDRRPGATSDGFDPSAVRSEHLGQADRCPDRSVRRAPTPVEEEGETNRFPYGRARTGRICWDGPKASPTVFQSEIGLKLPGGVHATVPTAKISDYLLSRRHARGRLKARFFVAMGYRPETPHLLRRDLLALARDGEVAEVVPSPFGTRYVVEGTIVGPVGVRFTLRSVWIALGPDLRPRFVTAYPIERPLEAL
ncbi:MAG: DUF6883 domain-containing protein [Gemmatimonadota bacterium]